MKAEQLLKTAIASNQYQASKRSAAQEAANFRQRDFTVTHAGYRDGAYLAQLPAGGTVRVQGFSNGAIKRGDTYNARVSGIDSKFQGNWQNYSGG